MPNPPKQSFGSILNDLDKLKGIPADPVYPEELDALDDDPVDVQALSVSLKRPTSPSSVAGRIKSKIDAHHGFFETGTRIIQGSHLEACPFCEQGITDPGPRAVIDAYLKYFSDEEEKHKGELRAFVGELDRLERTLSVTETALARQTSRFNALKEFVPSKKEER